MHAADRPGFVGHHAVALVAGYCRPVVVAVGGLVELEPYEFDVVFAVERAAAAAVVQLSAAAGWPEQFDCLVAVPCYPAGSALFLVAAAFESLGPARHHLVAEAAIAPKSGMIFKQ